MSDIVVLGGATSGQEFPPNVSSMGIEKLDAWLSNGVIRGICVTIDGRETLHGSSIGEKSSKTFAANEGIVQIKIWTSYFTNARIVGFLLETVGGTFQVGQPAKDGVNTVADFPPSNWLKGIVGRSGSDIDALGFIVGNEISG